MPIVTLTTDWIRDDYYCGVIKGRLLGLCPGLSIVDISHAIPPFNTLRAAFVIQNSYQSFPEGTIHIVGVDSEPAGDQKLIAVKFKNHYFIGNDNGIFGLIIRDKPQVVVELNLLSEPGSFGSLETFVTAAASLANGEKIESLGKPGATISRSIPRRAAIEKDVINGSVIYIDSYQNAITNISAELFKRIGQGRVFEIALQSNYYKLRKINKTYGETSVGELLAIFNSLDLLEIAINKGNASELLNLTTNSAIRVKFYNKNS